MSPVFKLLACSFLVSAMVLGTACSTWRAAMLYQRGTDELNRGEVTRALSDLARAAELEPDRSEIQNHLGLALSAAGRDEEALRAFELASELDCTNAAAAHNLALARAGRLGGAAAGTRGDPEKGSPELETESMGDRKSE